MKIPRARNISPTLFACSRPSFDKFSSLLQSPGVCNVGLPALRSTAAWRMSTTFPPCLSTDQSASSAITVDTTRVDRSRIGSNRRASHADILNLHQRVQLRDDVIQRDLPRH